MARPTGSTAVNLNPGDQVGKYSNIERLGSGAFGTVYLMRDTLINREVAVKFVKNQNPTAFVAHFEAQILHQCRNDRIVSVNSVDVVQDSVGRHFAAIDMEFIPDGSAQTLVERSHVTIRKAIKVTIDTLIALEHAHRNNILHRDIKPANIMIAGARAKLSDFGLAATASASLSASGAGSPVYCAPEVINDNATTIWTDIFSVGMTLFQLANNISNLAARIPSMGTIRMGRVIQTIGYSDYFPRRLRLVCNRACTFDPDHRYETAFAMRQALEKLQVKQEWTQLAQDSWQAHVGNQVHEMTIDHAPSIEMVYRINGRRKNANCVLVSSAETATKALHRWIYSNTF